MLISKLENLTICDEEIIAFLPVLIRLLDKNSIQAKQNLLIIFTPSSLVEKLRYWLVKSWRQILSWYLEKKNETLTSYEKIENKNLPRLSFQFSLAAE